MPLDIFIIGAGIAGLLAATRLQEEGYKVNVVDKGRSVGGRLATRRIGPGRADHGAQFFTVRHPEFRTLVEDWLAQGVVYEWARGWGTTDGHPRYAGRTGMTSIAKHLAGSLNVETNVRITAVAPTPAGWALRADSGAQYQARALLLTPPAPQSLALLAAGETQLHPDDAAGLNRIAYAPCLCGLFWVDGEFALPEPGAVQHPEEAAISWLADNQRKGISPAARLITVHAGPDFSAAHYDDPAQDVLADLVTALGPYAGPTAVIREKQLKKWRYARPTILHPQRTLLAQNLPPLAFAGDAFHEARVEGAALSGLAAAQALTDTL